MSYVSLDAEDGTTLRAFVARPAAQARRPAILVFQEAFGVNAHIRDVATRFAAEGYVAIAPELYHRTAPGFEGHYDNFDELRPHMAAMTVDGQTADIRAAHAWLVADPSVDARRIVAIGYCMGGRIAFLANTVLPLAAAATYYGSGIPALLDRTASLSGPQLFCWGGKDKHITVEQRSAILDGLRAAGKAFINVEFSAADHGFFCDARPAYHAESAAEAWALTLAFLGRHTGEQRLSP